jgi:hypothetical protein
LADASLNAPLDREPVNDIPTDAAASAGTNVPIAASPAAQKAAQSTTGTRGTPAKTLHSIMTAHGLMVITSPKGDRVGVYREGGSMKTYRVPDGAKASPILGRGLVALMVEGESISQLAAYSARQDAWSVLKLDQPVKGSAVPTVGVALAVTRAGRYLCAFVQASGAWHVVDLGDKYNEPAAGTGAPAPVVAESDYDVPVQPVNNRGVFGPILGPTAVAATAGRHAYAFSVATGKWQTIDLGEGESKAIVQSGKLITISKENGVFIFDGNKGKWEWMDLDTDKQP